MEIIILIAIAGATVGLLQKILRNFINKQKGEIGEKIIIKKLSKKYNYNNILKNSIYADKQGKTIEIDIIFVHNTGIYVFESKNYSGWIYGDEQKYKWTQVLQNRKKYCFYNPIMQNSKHIRVLKELLEKKYLFYNIIAFSQRCTIKKINYNNNSVIVDYRNCAVNQVIKMTKNNPKIYSDEEVNIIVKNLKSKAKFDSETRNKHISSINERFN